MNLISVILTIVVLSYDPAPGQFINLLPAVTTDPATAAQTSLERGSLVCLGAAGGSITARFSTPVANSQDYDITIYGNSFKGSAEPGVIFVSQDINNNGLADDPWYEIKGSEYSNTIHNYRITYYRPTCDSCDIPYRDSQGNTDVVRHLSFHTQPYYPTWQTADSLTFTGSLLPCNVTDTGSTIVFSSYDYGYADNHPNSDTTACSIKLDWAVDSLGNPANLAQADFIRIQTGVLYTSSMQTGELSTEISAIHALADLRSSLNVANENTPPVITATEILLPEPLTSPASVYTTSGVLVTTLPAGTSVFNLSSLPTNATYILRTHNASYRFIH